MWLDDKYKQYSYSQLREMLSMSEENRKQVNPDMSIEQIRELKKNKVAISQPEKKRFDYDKCMSLTGVAKQKYVCSRDKKGSVRIQMFNIDGSEINIPGLTNVWADLLEYKDGCISIRMWNHAIGETLKQLENNC